jgi:hypothetical protein
MKKVGKPHRGDAVCISEGHSNRVRCGVVHRENATVRYDDEGVTLHHMEFADPPNIPGDSGSPVEKLVNREHGHGSSAGGVLSGQRKIGSDVDSIISPPGPIEDKLNVNIITRRAGHAE